MPPAGKPCAFCAIIGGRREVSHVVHETDGVVAFLDIRPVFVGHTLVVPRNHIETLLDLPDEAIGPYFGEVQRVTAAVTKAMDAHGTFVALNNVVSQSVPHLHTHVVPRRRKDGLRGFFWPRTKYGSEVEMAETADRIRAAL
jgi:histidine triad (HIT) family protein